MFRKILPISLIRDRDRYSAMQFIYFIVVRDFNIPALSVIQS